MRLAGIVHAHAARLSFSTTNLGCVQRMSYSVFCVVCHSRLSHAWFGVYLIFLCPVIGRWCTQVFSSSLVIQFCNLRLSKFSLLCFPLDWSLETFISVLCVASPSVVLWRWKSEHFYQYLSIYAFPCIPTLFFLSSLLNLHGLSAFQSLPLAFQPFLPIFLYFVFTIVDHLFQHSRNPEYHSSFIYVFMKKKKVYIPQQYNTADSQHHVCVDRFPITVRY